MKKRVVSPQKSRLAATQTIDHSSVELKRVSKSRKVSTVKAEVKTPKCTQAKFFDPNACTITAPPSIHEAIKRNSLSTRGCSKKSQRRASQPQKPCCDFEQKYLHLKSDYDLLSRKTKEQEHVLKKHIATLEHKISAYRQCISDFKIPTTQKPPSTKLVVKRKVK